MFKSSFRCFTLIEMLVVIGIIAILASMLSPALRKTLATTHKTSCVNNYRQIGVAFNMYSSDYNGYLPPSRFGNPSTNGYKYMDWQSQLLLYSDPGWTETQRYSVKRRRTTIYWCNVTPVPTNGTEFALRDDEDLFRCAMRAGIDGKTDANGNATAYSARPRGKSAASPGKSMLVIECYRATSNTGEWNWHNYSGSVPHNATTNILYLDYHVDAQPKILIPQNQYDVFWGIEKKGQ